MSEHIRGFIEGALMARDNARQARRIVAKWAERDPVFADKYRENERAAWERARWSIERARQWKALAARA